MLQDLLFIFDLSVLFNYKFSFYFHSFDRANQSLPSQSGCLNGMISKKKNIGKVFIFWAAFIQGCIWKMLNKLLSERFQGWLLQLLQRVILWIEIILLSIIIFIIIFDCEIIKCAWRILSVVCLVLTQSAISSNIWRIYASFSVDLLVFFCIFSDWWWIC